MKLKRKLGDRVTYLVWALGLLCFIVCVTILIVMESKHQTLVLSNGAPMVNVTLGNHTPTLFPPAKWQVSTLASLIGLDRQYKLQGSILTLVSFCCVWMATITSTHVAMVHPDKVPTDFEEKGTLSNVSQDVTEPHGRLFTVALFTSGLLNIGAMYTFWLYRAWAPWYDPIENPLGHPTFQTRDERKFRTAWVIIPSVGFMFTAAIPSLSDTSGYKFALMIVHNVTAPLSMAACIVMETIQLKFGENAFEYFWTTDPAPVYGPLTMFQRMRVLVVMIAWICGVVFLGLQVYLGLGSALGMKIKTNYGLGLLSMFAEVGGMVLVAALPAIAGLGTQFEGRVAQGVLTEAMHLVHEG